MTITEKPAHWLDILRKSPYILLEKAVPVRSTFDYGITAVCIDVFEDGHGFYREGFLEEESADWRPDLSDPAGFGYALRLLLQTYSALGRQCCAVTPEMIRRHLVGQTTTADCLALAQALADVTS
jgi:hypothetical protein